VDAGGDKLNRKFRFAEFQKPQKLLQDFGGPLFPAMVAAFGVPLSTLKFVWDLDFGIYFLTGISPTCTSNHAGTAKTMIAINRSHVHPNAPACIGNMATRK
jgi:hypothetical protein